MQRRKEIHGLEVAICEFVRLLELVVRELDPELRCSIGAGGMTRTVMDAGNMRIKIHPRGWPRSAWIECSFAQVDTGRRVWSAHAGRVVTSSGSANFVLLPDDEDDELFAVRDSVGDGSDTQSLAVLLREVADCSRVARDADGGLTIGSDTPQAVVS
jgi:hypothetical protein